MKRSVTIDGNEAAARVAYRLNEVIAIYPITPASPMGELADEWSAQRRRNLWGTVPEVIEMQSEAGAIATVHGALQAGALATTFTASQGLLLMIPSLYKIAGELTPFVVHVAARTVATHALSIFGDHSDVMACRQTGFALLAAGSVQEAHDLACVAHAATLETRVPFLHFFDGFRTSHEMAKIVPLADEDIRAMIDERAVAAHRDRALTPEHPVIRGTAHNPDTFFQAREAANPFYLSCPAAVESIMTRLAARTGRRYRLFDYVGHPDADRVLVMMGSGAETAHETVDWLLSRGERVGVIKVRLYRPFSVEHFVGALPDTVRAMAVLDRTKEPGAPGEPLFLDVVAALDEARQDGRLRSQHPVQVVNGRYGLSSKEFTPGMVKAIFDELRGRRPRRRFSVGITDDVTGESLPFDRTLDLEPPDTVRAVFYGLGADGTVGANKSSIKIIGEQTDRHVQGYFVYDSKKSGATTVSHLRFGARPIRSPYRIAKAGFVACHQFDFLDRFDVLETAAPGATVLLNAPGAPDEVWDRLPAEFQEQVIARGLKLWTIDAGAVASGAGLGRRINTIMQTCFFAISGILPADHAIREIKAAIEKTYGRRGAAVVQRNHAAVDAATENLHQLSVPEHASAQRRRPPIVADDAPDFVKRVTALIMANQGDLLPVSAFPVDGTWPVGTARWEKRNIALEIPVWDGDLCIQCNKCAMVCPHAAIRAKVYDPAALAEAPPGFKAVAYRGPEFPGERYTIQVAPEDCTGCALCVEVCPVRDKARPRHKAIDMQPLPPLRDLERECYAFFLNVPEARRSRLKLDVKGVQFMEPLFEYSGACAGCGETPYIKLLTQLFGDRTYVANATGCSSIYGGNLPTTPYTTNRDGRGVAWANSLFEDTAEFGLGFRLAVDTHAARATALLRSLAPQLGDGLVRDLIDADLATEGGIEAQRARVASLRARLAPLPSAPARHLERLADFLVTRSVWIVGGDGWAYDIGYGGLDHVLATGSNVNVLVLDTEVYSNTGGQQSKATPIGATAKFAVGGKERPKKDLALLAMSYGHVYVARVAFGARDTQTVRAFVEAESYPGPSLIIAYSPCIAHGYDLAFGARQQKLAVETGYWPLFRFDPRREAAGSSALEIDVRPRAIDLARYMETEPRFRLAPGGEARAGALAAAATREARRRFSLYDYLAGFTSGEASHDASGGEP